METRSSKSPSSSTNTSTSLRILSPPVRKTRKFTLAFLKDGVQEYQSLYKRKDENTFDIDEQYISPRETDITAISRYNRPLLGLQGFQLIDFNKEEPEEQAVKYYLQQLANADKADVNMANTREGLRDSIKLFILKFMRTQNYWTKPLGLEFNHAVVLDAVYRDTTPNVDSRFGSVNLSHVDFDGNMTDIAQIRPFYDTWKQKLEKELGREHTHSRGYWLSGKKIVKMFNIWISLTEEIKDDALALMDITTLDPTQIVRYIATRTSRKKRCRI